MDLSTYFESDDGSLPEIEISFKSPESLQTAFAFLFELGAENVAKNGSYLWLRRDRREMPFTGPRDAALVTAGQSDSFHVLLGGITVDDLAIPALGVLVDPQSLVIDYRMGPHWTRPHIGALLNLLKHLIKLGGSISVARWWGADGQDDFSRYLGSGA